MPANTPLPPPPGTARLRRLAGWLCTCALLAGAGAVSAQTSENRRPWERPAGQTVADLPSPHYRFETLPVQATGGDARYQVRVGVPRRSPPPGGHPVIYLLDGTAALASIDDDDLAALGALTPPVIVAIGHDLPEAQRRTARAYDYTPPVVEHGRPVDVTVRGQRGGGADRFLALITTHIQPAVQALAPVDTQRQTLWGHSYGGLFTLYTLWTDTPRFQRYAAGDPSLWWHDGYAARQMQTYDARRAAGVDILLLTSGGTRRGAGGTTWTAGDIATHLRGGGARVTDEALTHLHHGELLPASLKPALRLAATPAQGDPR